MCHFTRLRLQTALLAILFVCAVSFAQAQEEQNNQYVIVEKIIDKDGNQTVTKKRVGEEERLITILHGLKDIDGTTIDIQIINEDGEHVELEEAIEDETLMLIRRAREPTEEAGELHERMEQIRIVIRDGEEAIEREHKTINWYDSDSERPFVGIYVDESSNAEGVAISSTISGGGAEAAGLEAADVITAINEQPIRDRHDLREAIAGFEPGETVTVTYQRYDATAETELTLTARNVWTHRSYERDPCKVFIGVYVGGRGSDGYGVRVNGIIDDTPAEDAGMQSGDLILALDEVPVSSHSELLRERNKHEPGDWFTLTYMRDGVPTDIRAQFGACEEEPAQEELIPEEVVTEEVPEAPITPQLQIDNTLQLERLEIYPNPTYGELRVEFESEALPTTVRILDAAGRTILEDVRNRFDGYYNEQLDLTGQNSGQYFLQIIQGDKVLTEKVVKVVRA